MVGWAYGWIGVMMLLALGCASTRERAKLEPMSARERIVTALPEGWRVVPQSSNQSMITKAWFGDPRTEAFAVVGPRRVEPRFADREGRWQAKPMGHEGLRIWVMPADYSVKLPWYNPKVGPLPKRVYAGRGVQVYGDVHGYMTAEEETQFKEELRTAQGVASDTAPVSWRGWQRELATALAGE